MYALSPPYIVLMAILVDDWANFHAYIFFLFQDLLLDRQAIPNITLLRKKNVFIFKTVLKSSVVK